MPKPAMNRLEVSFALRRIEREALKHGVNPFTKKQLLRITKGMLRARGSFKTPLVYRSRKNEGNRLFNSVSCLWYPPAKVARRGRLNEPGCPVFYCSNNHSVALLEQRPSSGDVITVLSCTLKQPHKSVVIGDFGAHILDGQPLLSGIRYDPNWLAKAFGRKKVNYSATIDSIFGRWFSEKNPAYYPLTKMIADYLFSKGTVDGIVYPTVVWQEGFNLALTTKSADKLLTPEQAFAVRIDNPSAWNVGDSPGHYVSVSREITGSGEIIWDKEP